jgi:hypothetical protein
VTRLLAPDEGDTHHEQGRFVTALHVTGEGRQCGPGTLVSRACCSNGCELTYSPLGFGGTADRSRVAISDSGIDGREGSVLPDVEYGLPDGATVVRSPRVLGSGNPRTRSPRRFTRWRVGPEYRL